MNWKSARAVVAGVLCIIVVATIFGAHWYPVALVVLALPQCWMGGRLYELTHQPA